MTNIHASAIHRIAKHHAVFTAREIATNIHARAICTVPRQGGVRQCRFTAHYHPTAVCRMTTHHNVGQHATDLYPSTGFRCSTTKGCLAFSFVGHWFDDHQGGTIHRSATETGIT